MSSINPYYTFKYSQPESYRFSHDSVFLARRAFEIVHDEVKSNWRGLDLCAGSGIVGLDFLFHCKTELKLQLERFDFLEVQNDYASHFEINKGRLNNEITKIQFLNKNYCESLHTQYDLILCNPPYFNPEEGQLSPNQFKNRCRFFIDGTRAELMAAIDRALAPKGRAFVLSRKENPPCPVGLRARPCGDIRGTPLFCFERNY